jgi:copper chaperone
LIGRDFRRQKAGGSRQNNFPFIKGGLEGLSRDQGMRRKEENKMGSVLKVKGMSCQHCVMSVTKALSQLDGIKNVQVDLAKREVQFDNTKEIASNRIEKAITDAGYEVVSNSK